MIEYQVKVFKDGTQEWYLNGNLHREDGPARESADGYKEWYLNGNRHREDGPAIEWVDGTKSWYLNGEKMTEAQHQAATQETILTMDEVARLAGVPVERLKIQK
jgi:hypothetical protein